MRVSDSVTVAAQGSREHDGSHLSKKQARQLEAYMAKLLKRLDLAHWRVHVAKDLPPDGALLMIEPTDGRRLAMLYIHEDWWTRQGPEDKRSDLLHEALHLTHHDQEYVVRHFVNGAPARVEEEVDVMWHFYKLETERMVDSLSYALARYMPPWPYDRPVRSPQRAAGK